ncbi:hypothetical protein ACTJJ0_25995 [Chitinophaga sp. 22321]|uniref:Natural product n=1 Tax=Chitinophaga hostae TaxID=2831022 RepID=A0ABS5J5J6_9BACT|nr:hypothetical protein [Chitinophaga hostae]MBS0030358.1 hypothetical protein [Chitinophaga hostae]
MKKLTLKALQLGATEVLTREQLKNVLGGDGSNTSGTRCVVYCCDSSNNCGSGTTLPGVDSCSSNENCQNIAVQGGATCPSGYYVAALCKG